MKKTKSKYKRSQLFHAYSEAIVQTIREPLIVLDSDLCVITANRAFYKIFHTTKKDTESKLLYNLGNGQWNNPRLRFLLKDIIPQKSFFQDFELEHEFPTIGKRVMLLNGSKVIQADAKKPMILLTIEDITEKKQIERQKDDFISIASHELKTPVTSLKVYAQILQKHPLITNDKKASEMLTKMDMQMNRLTELVASFMNVYKLGSGKLRLRKEHFELVEQVVEVVANFQYTINSHVVEQSGIKNAEIYADKERINQVLVNLISNAIKYSPGAKTVKVKVAKKADNVVVSVQDFGLGIPLEEQDRIYERFFRAKGKKESNIPGLGLGLFISAEIIKQHSGKLWVNSTEGHGATFYFSLPIYTPNLDIKKNSL